MSEIRQKTLPEVVITLRPDGILDYDYTTNLTVNIGVAHKAVNAAIELVTEPVPTLVRINAVKEVTREARVFFAESEENRRVSSKVALIIGSPIARIIGNFFIGLNKGPMPVQLFTDADAAAAWLRS